MGVTLAQDMKRVSISSKRQITIPQAYYNLLGFDREAECILKGETLVIRPVHTESSGEFAEQILEELVAEGLTGEALLCEFRKRQKEVRPAVERMLQEAAKVAEGTAEYATLEDVFGEE